MRTLLDRSHRPNGRLVRAAARPALLAAAVVAAASVAGAVSAAAQTTPSLALSPPTVTIDVPKSGAHPSMQAVVVRALNAPAGVAGLTITGIAYQTVDGTAGFANWLKVDLDGATTPAVLQVGLAGVEVPGGTYRATLSIKGDGTATQTLVVTLTRLATRPELVLSATDAVPLRAKPGDQGAVASRAVVAMSADHRVPVGDVSVGTPQYTYGAPGWLTTTIDHAWSPAVVTLTARRMVNGRPLAPGQYTARVPISATRAAGNPKMVTVVFTIPTASAPPVGSPAFAMTPGSGYGYGGSGTGGANPSTRLVTFAGMPREIVPVVSYIGNNGGGWLEGVTIDSVTYQGGTTGWFWPRVVGGHEYGTMVATAFYGAFQPGHYTAVAHIRAAGDPNPHTYTVTIDVLDPRAVLAVASPSSSNGEAIFSASRAGADPEPQSITIRNDAPKGSDRDLTGLRLGAISYGAGASGWLSAELTGSIASASIVLRARTGALREGSYVATIPIFSDTGVLAGPHTLTVKFGVRPSATPTLALSVTSVTFRPSAASPTPVQTVGVRNTGGGTLSGLAVDPIQYGTGQPQGWLTATLGGTAAYPSLALTAAQGTLPGGTYTARVTVRAAAGTLDSPQSLDVTMVVAPRPVIALSAPEVLLSARANATTPQTATLQVTNVGDAPLAGLSASPAYDGATTGWMTAALGATSATATAPATLTVRAPTRALAAGVYTGTVRVSGTGATAVTARVTLEVVDVAAAQAALVDATRLPDAERARLDRLGNRDGTYNLGDFVALRARLGLAN